MNVRGQLAAMLVVGCAGLCGACGSEPVEVAPPPTTQPAPRDEPLSKRAGTADRLTITVSETAPGRARFSAPHSVRAGLVELRLRNTGKAPHKAQLWRIDGDHTVREARRAGRPLPGWLRAAGGVALTEPGATGTTVQILRPGRYYVAGTGGKRDIVAELRVSGKAADAALPGAAARLDAYEFAFRTKGLKAGRTPVDFRNTGREPHHVFFAPMRTGASLAEVRRFFTGTDYVGVPPVDDVGTRDTVVLEGGERQVTELDLRPGRYALLCFVRNRSGGPPHTKLGMIDEVRVP